LWFTVATALGMVVGRAASRHLSARHVQAGFAIVLVCVALGLLAKAAFSA
ncbi:MAG: sulfite exporter TauE/SafE family protein, partial [Burkholderia vietnamiensis]|nr:sulfite exporter TauE/SafE family protein [Burkholderia vietnamiensis]